MHDLIRHDDNAPATRRGGSAAMVRELTAGRMSRVSDVIDGEADEIDVGDVIFAVELVTPLTRSDHMRLLRAASVAIQYWSHLNPGGHHPRPAFLKRVAAALQVDAAELGSYVLVLEREIRYRETTGESPLTSLPRLVDTEPEAPEMQAMLAIAPATRFKHDPSVYVELREQGLNNSEISRHLGDVSESGVRRGLNSVGYKPSSAACEETDG